MASSAASLSPTTQALLGVAVLAADEARYCDALWLFEALHLRRPSPRALYNAAEVAFAAGDRVKALEFYRLTQQRYPDFGKASLVQSRANKVFADMIRGGPGTACPLRDDVCGDWMLRPTDGGEQCDDGNLDSGDGCDANCTITRCGNGIVTVGEQCDDGNAIDGDGCDRTCVPTGCGNKVVTPGEQCDDGNNVNGDGCDAGCTVSRCGNAVVTGLEQCDDGNDVAGDGCETDCTLTRVKQPLPGLVVLALGGAAAIGGGAAAFGGLQTYAVADDARQRLADAENAFAVDPAGSLAGIDARHADAARANANARNIGGPLVAGGIGVAAVGLVGLGVGAWIALTNTEIGGGAQ